LRLSEIAEGRVCLLPVLSHDAGGA
jgi:hypothetical protein